MTPSVCARVALACILVPMLLLLPLPRADAAAPTTPIEHLVVVMQEGHSFDNYFATYGDGVPNDVCMPIHFQGPATECVRQFHIGDRSTAALGDSSDLFEGQFHGGQMDGFVSALSALHRPGELTMGYYDQRDLPFYWNLADRFVLFDRFFASTHGGSLDSHTFWMSAVPANAQVGIPSDGLRGIMTIFDELQAAGVSWKVYVQDYNPTITYHLLSKRHHSPAVGVQLARVPLLAMPRFADDPEFRQHIVEASEYFRDLHEGTLPAVSFITPSSATERPPATPRGGQLFVRSLVNGLIASEAWASSAFILTYDGWGGWYDHVRPPKVDGTRYGFRVPTILVSPFARMGFVDHTTLDNASILRFVEDNYDLDPLSARDAHANSIESSFDLSAIPRAPVLVPYERASGSPPIGNQGTIVAVSYTAAIVLACLFLAAAGLAMLRTKAARSPDGRDRE